jgi:hypothetical protein
VTTSVCSADQPSCALASVTDDSAGRISTSSMPRRLTSVVPIPDSKGSPLASTQTLRPAYSASSPSSAGSSGLGHGTLGALSGR